VQSFITSQGSTTNVQGQRLKVKVTGSKAKFIAYCNVSAIKRYKTATDRLCDFKLGMGVVNKADKDWRRAASSCNASQRLCWGPRRLV